MSTYYYVRVSTADQSTDNQVNAIAARYAKADRVFMDHGVSGTKAAMSRPGFSDLMSVAQAGDTVIVTAIDRLGRNTVDVITTIENMLKKGLSVVSLRESVDFATSTGRLVMRVLAAVAEMERENIIERTKQGLKQAQAKGVVLGRQVTEKGTEARKLITEGHSCAEVMAQTGISKAAYYKIKKAL